MIRDVDPNTPFPGVALVWCCYGAVLLFGLYPQRLPENSALFLDPPLTFQQTPRISLCQQLMNVLRWSAKHVDTAPTSFVRAVCGS